MSARAGPLAAIAGGELVLRPLTAAGVLAFTREDVLRLIGLYGFIVALHAVGWGLYLHYAAHYPALVGLGLVAYLFGLRHAFDADHVAAVDDTVRLMLQQGRQPLAVGFWFSLGHSTIVFLLAIAIAVAASAVAEDMPFLQRMGGVIGAGVSGVFLWIIGVLNLVVLLGILDVWRKGRSGTHDHEHLARLLGQRGLLNRLFGRRFTSTMRHAWQMYPLGLLFGLGFDTASEIGLLAMTAGASAGNLPVAAVLSLPILFAAGMTVMDTTDGVLMCKAYDWAFVNPLRKIFYNLTTTALSVVVALVIGTIELAQVLIDQLALKGAIVDRIAALDFASLGYLVVGLFAVAFAASVAVWKFGRFEARAAGAGQAHAHRHVHADGLAHTHEHFH